MFPGYATRLSHRVIAASTTIEAKGADLIIISDTAITTAIATIDAQFSGFAGIVWLENVSGANMSLTTAGNIQVARTIPTDMVITMVWDPVLTKWIPGPIS